MRAVEEGVNLNFLKLVTVSCWQEWTWHHPALLLRTTAARRRAGCAARRRRRCTRPAGEGQEEGRRCGGDARPRTHQHDPLPRLPGYVGDDLHGVRPPLLRVRRRRVRSAADLPRRRPRHRVLLARARDDAAVRGGDDRRLAVGRAAPHDHDVLAQPEGPRELRAEQSSLLVEAAARLALLMSRRSSTAAGIVEPRLRLHEIAEDGPDGERTATDLAALEKRSREAHEEAKEEILVFAIRDRRWIESRLKHYARCAWFDLVEIARKLLLTGFAVLLEQGSMAQLVAGCLLASAMLDDRAAAPVQALRRRYTGNWLPGCRRREPCARDPAAQPPRRVGSPPPRIHHRHRGRRRLRRGGGARPLGGDHRPRPHRRRRQPIVGAVVLAVAQLCRIRRAPSLFLVFLVAPGTRRRSRAKGAACADRGGERRGARHAREQPAYAPPRPLRLPPPPLAAPPTLSANERWRAAGLAVTTVSRLQMEARARGA